MTSPATDDLAALDGDQLWSFQEFSDWLRARWPGRRGLTYERLRAHRHEFEHIQIGKAFLLTAEQRRAFLARYTQKPADPKKDGLDATRDRIARQRARTAPKPRSRKAA